MKKWKFYCNLAIDKQLLYNRVKLGSTHITLQKTILLNKSLGNFCQLAIVCSDKTNISSDVEKSITTNNSFTII